MKRIYTGWYTDRLRKEWIEKCRLDLKAGQRNFLFLLPTRHLIQDVRESLTLSGVGVSDQIGTFDDLVDLGLSGEKQIVRIDEQGKLAVLNRVLELAGEESIAPFRKIMDKPGFLQSLLDAIEELKSSGITYEHLAANNNKKNEYVDAFIEIYHIYQKLLREHAGGRLLDRQEGYRVAAEHLLHDGERLLQGIDKVYIDFLTVTPLQASIVEAICKYVPHVEIFMPYPPNAEGIPLLQKSGSRLLSSLRKLGVEHVELQDYMMEDTCGRIPLSRVVFEEIDEKISLPGVELIPSASALQEVRAVAKEIKRLVKNGWSADEIAVVAADDVTYRPLIRQVFQDHQIAVSLADIQNVMEIPLVRRIIQSISQAISEQHPDFTEKMTYTRCGELIRQWVSSLYLVEDCYANAATEGVYRLDDLRRDLRGWQACQDMLESLIRAKRLYGEKEVSFLLFWKEWKELLYQSEVQVDGGAGQGVRIYRPAEIRGLSWRAVFILGLNEGHYPKKLGDHWLIQRIEQVTSLQGWILQRQEQSDLQNLLFRYSLQTAKEKLYLGFQSPQVDERNLPSPFLEAVLRCVKEGELTSPPRFASALSSLPIPDRWEELSSQQEWKERMAIWLGGQASLHVADQPGDDILTQFEKEIAHWNPILQRLAVESERNKGLPSQFAGRIDDPDIIKLLQGKFGSQYPWSVSLLNDYAVCPFKFFAARVLKMEAPEEAADGISVQDRGTFLHELTQQLLLPLTGVTLVEVSHVQELLKGYDPIFKKVCQAWEDKEMAQSPYWPAEKERLQKEMRLWYERELTSLLQSRLSPTYLEWSFEWIVLQVGDEPMGFRGRIDRIDTAEDGSHFAIYDYKSSLNPKKYKGLKDLQEGTNWQLPIYLSAYKEWVKQQGKETMPVGGGFYQLSPVSVKMAGVWAEDAAAWGVTEIKKSDRSEDLQAELEEALEQIAQQRDSLRNGIFDAHPRVECDPYCKFLSVCRYSAK